MKIIEQYHEIISIPENLLQIIEKAGRTCYKSEDKITPDSAEKFVQMLIDRGHYAMIEFGYIIVKFVTNRGITHELCSFEKENTRYVNYGGDDIQFIKPVWLDDCDLIQRHDFECSCGDTEYNYKTMLRHGWSHEQACEVLPNALKTEIIVKGNIHEWRHTFTFRCSKATHPQMRALMIPCMHELRGKLPVVFDDIEPR